MRNLSQQDIKSFQKLVYDYYYKHRRSFAWREEISAYRVVVSEIMLQQTQTFRVVHKFEQWMQAFPSFKDLSQASVQQVLSCWQGLGYNRRGLALYEFAKRVEGEFGGIAPTDEMILQTFKGIGPNTAGSICVFAFNKPVVFIETNIRTVFIHTFFKGQKDIHDKQLLPLIEQTLDQDNARDWYYALMDYGVYLKTKLKVSNKASKHYTKQSRFEGSRRQMRGAVVRVLSKVHTISYDELSELIVCELPQNHHDLYNVLSDLSKDGLLRFSNGEISLY